MKRLIITVAFALISMATVAQDQSKSESTWEDNTNGTIYKMKASANGVVVNTSAKPHISFKIDGDTANLSKIAFTGNDLTVTVPVSKTKQDISVAPGAYKFKFYHSKLGMKEFELNLKNGDERTVILTLK
ncbi:MAG: hypothetical protein EOO07_27415 [Chitinophagaceae bacterium]|nr:MAG: hypothetical protein EOO07_27415 [Chitinophagaceae bacterium]